MASRNDLVNAAFREAIASTSSAIDQRHIFVAAWSIAQAQGHIGTAASLVDIRRALDLPAGAHPEPPADARVRRYERTSAFRRGPWHRLQALMPRTSANVIGWDSDAARTLSSIAPDAEVDIRAVLTATFPQFAGALAQIGITARDLEPS